MAKKGKWKISKKGKLRSDIAKETWIKRKEKFGNRGIKNPEMVSKKISRANTGKTRPKGFGKKVWETRKKKYGKMGVKNPEEVKLNMSISNKERVKQNHNFLNYWKNKTEEERKKIINKANNSRKLKRENGTYKPHRKLTVVEKKKKLKKFRKTIQKKKKTMGGFKWGMYNKHHTVQSNLKNRKSRLKYISENKEKAYFDSLRGRINCGKIKEKSSLEIKVENIINDLNMPYKFVGKGSFWIENMNPDFINTNGQKKVIEVLGSYWHNKEETEKRIEKLRKCGFKCLPIWDYDLKDKQSTIERIKEFDRRN